jgi:hypothetical protein
LKKSKKSSHKWVKSAIKSKPEMIFYIKLIKIEKNCNKWNNINNETKKIIFSIKKKFKAKKEELLLNFIKK